MRKLSRFNNNNLKRLSKIVEPLIEPSARARGFALDRIISHWDTIVGEISTWCRPDTISYPKNSVSEGTLRLQIASGRGPEAQALTSFIIDQVNANFGYNAIGKISLIQTLEESTHSSDLSTLSTSKPHTTDVWTLDDKLQHVKSPKVRAALRQLGIPYNLEPHPTKRK